MENPATWSRATWVISDALAEAQRQRDEKIIGYSTARIVEDALTVAGLLESAPLREMSEEPVVQNPFDTMDWGTTDDGPLREPERDEGESRSELEPCPFCGSEWQPQVTGRSNGAYWVVSCSNDDCTAQLMDDTKELAIAAWNRRAESQSLRSQIEYAEKRYEQVKLQAETWAQEARAQTATVHECYAACGVQGKGTFHGAEPVRQFVATAGEVIEQMAQSLQSVNRLTAPGGRTLDDFIRDMGLANDITRAALTRAEEFRKGIGR